jgi:hypothetical protein
VRRCPAAGRQSDLTLVLGGLINIGLSVLILTCNRRFVNESRASPVDETEYLHRRGGPEGGAVRGAVREEWSQRPRRVSSCRVLFSTGRYLRENQVGSEKGRFRWHSAASWIINVERGECLISDWGSERGLPLDTLR